MERTYIKLFRGLLKWEWFDSSNHLHVFIFLLLNANHSPGTWRGIPVKRGDFITSLGKISKGTGLSLQKIRTVLRDLERTGEITSNSTNKYRVISIVNYSDFQGFEEKGKSRANKVINKQANKQLTSNQQATNKQSTTNNNENNDNNDNNEKKDIVCVSTREENFPGLKHGVIDPEFFSTFKKFYGSSNIHYRADTEQGLIDVCRFYGESGKDIKEFLINVGYYIKLCRATKTKIKYARNWLEDQMYLNDYKEKFEELKNTPNPDLKSSNFNEILHSGNKLLKDYLNEND